MSPEPATAIETCLIYNDKVFLATNDAFLVALDARTGELVWETQRADYREQVAQTAGPIVVKGRLITGSRCNPQSPRPGGCFITAHDANTGQELWRINTAATPDQPGGDTWGGLPVSARRHASAWMVGSYDPDLDLVFWGTGPPSPLPEKLRGAGKADLLYTNSTLGPCEAWLGVHRRAAMPRTSFSTPRHVPSETLECHRSWPAM